MKIIFSILFFILLTLMGLTSCKKLYSCTCFTKVTNNGVTSYARSSNIGITEKLTKNQAKAVCAHEAESINETSMNYVSRNGQVPTTQSFDTQCYQE